MRSIGILVATFSVTIAMVMAALPGCDEDPKGQLMVAVTTDMTPGTDFDALKVELVYGSAPRQTKLFTAIGQPESLRFPFTFAIVAGTQDVPVQVRITTGVSSSRQSDVGTPLTFHEINAKVPSDRVALARMHLDFLCAGYLKARPSGEVDGLCPAEYSCAARLCTRANREPTELPSFDERRVFGGSLAREGTGACFDTVQCFSQGNMATIGPGCTIERPQGGVGVSVALVTRPRPGEPRGICGSAACYVALDANVPHGVQLRDGRISLPKEVCDRIERPPSDRTQLAGVAVTTACATKTTEIPTCGTWSAAQGTAFTFNAGPPIGYRVDGAAEDASEAGDAATD